MAYEFYAAKRNMYNPPNEEWKNDLQAFIDDQFNNTVNVYSISEELTFGTLDWSSTDVIITRVINSNTGENIGKDWKKIIFKDIDHSRGLGYRYYFDNSTWITVNYDPHNETASSIIRRCNHTFKWYDDSNVLVEEPGIVDYYDFTKDDNVWVDKNMRIGDNIRFVVLQNNDNSYNIRRDERFIIDRLAYRVINFDSITKSGLYLLTLEEHQINTQTDDIVDSVADETSYGSGGGLW